MKMKVIICLILLVNSLQITPEVKVVWKQWDPTSTNNVMLYKLETALNNSRENPYLLKSLKPIPDNHILLNKRIFEARTVEADVMNDGQFAKSLHKINGYVYTDIKNDNYKPAPIFDNSKPYVDMNCYAILQKPKGVIVYIVVDKPQAERFLKMEKMDNYGKPNIMSSDKIRYPLYIYEDIKTRSGTFSSKWKDSMGRECEKEEVQKYLMQQLVNDYYEDMQKYGKGKKLRK